MIRVTRKPDFCICENKGADQLCGNRTADQRLCFRYKDSSIPLLSKSEDMFSHNEANIMLVLIIINDVYK